MSVSTGISKDRDELRVHSVLTGISAAERERWIVYKTGCLLHFGDTWYGLSRTV